MSRKQAAAAGSPNDLWEREYHDHDAIASKTFGFWLYMMGDALLFAALFAAYGVLDHKMNMAHGPNARAVAHPVTAFVEAILVFASVFAYGVGMVGLKAGSRIAVIGALFAAIVFGAAFLGLEINDFATLIHRGITPERSGFLSIYFVLIGVHGLHMALGLLWMLVMIAQVVLRGFTADVVTRLLNLRLFWVFQASIWVCVFVFVYLRGAY